MEDTIDRLAGVGSGYNPAIWALMQAMVVWPELKAYEVLVLGGRDSVLV